ncbi:MAG: autotransporter domain-containing protein [Opitutales bacterium]|nr:autotransporter domain-containing protein [Opitutales bacterium]
MTSPLRLPLTLLFAGATALSAVALNAETVKQVYNGELYDPLFKSQWQWDPASNGINITSAWLNGYMGEGVIIGIIDQWVDPEHPDLADNYNAEWSKDFVNTANDNDTVKYDGETHGTFVAGMAAAVGQNNVGIIGAAPKAQLAGLHVDLSPEQVIQAYYWGSGINAVTGAWEGDAAIHIKNCSFGYDPYYVVRKTEADRAALDKTTRNNTIYVIAAGNSRSKTNEGSATVPADCNGDAVANYEGGIVVGSTSRGGYYSGFSCYGSNLFVTAPGEAVFSTTRYGLTMTADDEVGNTGEDDGNTEASFSIRAGDDTDNNKSDSGSRTHYTYSSGTSFSTPIVSGVIALAAASNEAMDVRWAKHALARSCDILDVMRNEERSKGTVWTTNSAGFEFSNDYGFGLVNAENFINVAENIAYETIRTSSTVSAGLSGNKDAWTSREAVKATANVNGLAQPVESVEVTFTIDNINYFQDAQVVLVSPTGTRSVLLDKAWLSDNKEANAYEEVYNAAIRENGTTALTWTYVSNAFWGVSEAGDWTVEFINNGTGTAKVSDVSLKFNTGTVEMESASMSVSEQLDVHALVLDRETTNFTVVGARALLCVEDSVIVNNGTLTVGKGGKITAYDPDWKGVKVALSGGQINLEEDGIIEAPRGIDVSGGKLSLNGGSISGGSLNITGGSVEVNTANSQVSRIDLSGNGMLTTRENGTLSVGIFNMSGGTFNMGGKNELSVDASGGAINVASAATVQAAKIGATATSAASLTIDKGATLYVGTEFNGIGVLEIEGFHKDAVVTEEGEETEAAVTNYATAVVKGSIEAGSVDVSRGTVQASDAVFKCGVTLAQKSALALSGTTQVEGRTGLSLTDSELYAADGAVLKLTQSSLKVLGGSYFQIGGGTGSGTTHIESGVDVGFVCQDSRLGVVFGDELVVNKDVQIRGNSVVELAFQNKLPRDTIEFINLEAGKTVSVDDSVSVEIDATAPTLWDGQQEIALVYDINTNGTIEAQLPGSAELVPVRLTYSQMTDEQKAIAQSLRTCLSDGENANVSAELLAELNSFEYLDPLLSAYDQLLPVNLVTINSLNNKQASAVTGALERRSRELRRGYPVSDLWSAPLFNSYGFSFSANPNAVASNGMRQFVGYDFNDERAMLWANGGYSFSDGDATSHVSKTETDMTNASIGFDYAVNDRLAIGLFASYSGGSTEMKATGSKTEAAMRSLGVYFAGSRNDKEGNLYYMGMASYGVGEYDFTRSTKIGNYNSKATASPDGSQAIGYLAAGWEWDAGSQALSYQWTTGPMVSLRYVYNSVDSYAEQGNGADALNVDSFSYDSLQSSLGWRTTVRFDVKETITFVPEARISWQHEFLDSAENIGAQIALPGTTPFSTKMNKEGSDYVTAGVGVTVLIAESTTLSLDYDVNFLREDSGPEHNFNLMMRCRF